MLPVIYGVSKAYIGIGEVFEKCPACESHTFHEAFFTSNYYHFFFMPIFPFEKEVTLTCTKCKLRRKDVPLTKKSISNYSEINKEYKHPLYTYTFIIILLVIIALPLIWLLINPQS